MITNIQESILAKLMEVAAFNNIKFLSVPLVNFDDVRQNVIVNIKYVSEEFIVPNIKKMQYSQLPTKKRISDLKFELEIYYKDLRNKFEEVYNLLDSLINTLHGELLNVHGLNISPIYITNIQFVERNSNNFIIYKCNLELRRC